MAVNSPVRIKKLPVTCLSSRVERWAAPDNIAREFSNTVSNVSILFVMSDNAKCLFTRRTYVYIRTSVHTTACIYILWYRAGNASCVETHVNKIIVYKYASDVRACMCVCVWARTCIIPIWNNNVCDFSV